MSTKKKSTKSTKSVKSVKPSTATKVAKKSSKAVSKPRKKACGCIPPPLKGPVVNSEGYSEYPDIADEYEYSEDGFDSMGNDIGITKYYYVSNSETKKKFIISGFELPFSFAKVIGEESTGGDVYIVKVSSPLAWLFSNVFRVEKLDANKLIVEAIDAL